MGTTHFRKSGFLLIFKRQIDKVMAKLIFRPIDGQNIVFKNIGSAVVVRNVTETVTNETNYNGDGIEEDSSLNDHSNNEKVLNHVGSVVALHKAGSIVNKLNVSINPQQYTSTEKYA